MGIRAMLLLLRGHRERWIGKIRRLVTRPKAMLRRIRSFPAAIRLWLNTAEWEEIFNPRLPLSPCRRWYKPWHRCPRCVPLDTKHDCREMGCFEYAVRTVGFSLFDAGSEYGGHFIAELVGKRALAAMLHPRELKRRMRIW